MDAGPARRMTCSPQERDIGNERSRLQAALQSRGPGASPRLKCLVMFGRC